MQNIETRTIREIAIEVPQTTRVFEKFNIDYCCGGRKPFNEGCLSAGADPLIVRKEIEEISVKKADGATALLKTLSLEQIIDYIVKKHHSFTETEIAALNPLMEKVAVRHGENHPYLLDLKYLFQSLSRDLQVHLKKEEFILFPYIIEMEKAEISGIISTVPHFGTVKNPVRMMTDEHDIAGDILRKMREVTNNYTLPAGACPSFQALYHRLQELQADLHEHIHLENNLLFPRAVDLEQKIFS